MNNITMEQRQQLVDQARSRYRQDQNDLLHREQLLYGKTSVDRLERDAQDQNSCKKTGRSAGMSSFRLRFLAALAIFALILIFDKNEKDLFGISTKQIFQSISRDFMEEAGENLENIRNAF